MSDITARIHRALSQPIYLLEAAYKKDKKGEDFWAFKVEGATGRKYRVHFHGSKGVQCQCPDFQQRHRHCKHIFFIFSRVLKNTDWAERIAKCSVKENPFDLFPDFHIRMGCTIGRRIEETERKEATWEDEQEEAEIGEECVICYEKVSGKHPLDWVCDQGGCYKHFHRRCLMIYARHLRDNGEFNCPLCRKHWISVDKKRLRDETDDNGQGLAKLSRVTIEALNNSVTVSL